MIRRSRGRAGFTAEELIVVLGMIMLMAGGFLWTTRRVSATSRMVSCASNLRQIGEAARMYVMDYDGRMPPQARSFDALLQYTKNQQVFLCPAERRREERLDEDASKPQTDSDRSWWDAGLTLEPHYVLDPAARPDDPPQTLVAADDEPGRHVSRTWLGVRVDGALRRFDAEEWDRYWGEVRDDDEAQ
ncbi:MAG: type II secretion system protein [Armatimonadota bacterium]